MAFLYNVNDSVACQKTGGKTGTKPVTPRLTGKVAEVLTGGLKYRVDFDAPGYDAGNHFVGFVVDESDMTAV